MALRKLAKLHRSDHDDAAVEDSAWLAGRFPLSKSMALQFSPDCVRGRLVRALEPKSMLRALVNQLELLVAVAPFESPLASRLRNATRSVPTDEDRWTPVVVAGDRGGFLLLGVVGGFRSWLAAPSDCAFSNAVEPRAARLNDCEFRDSVPRALLSESSRDIVALTGAMVPAGWLESVLISEKNYAR